MNSTSSVKLRILVAEDNAVNQKVISTILSRAGHEVTLVSDGQATLDAVNSTDFDALLLDIQMPLIDGLSVARNIRITEVLTAKRLVIIALTAHAMLEDQQSCLDAGMDEFITKPINKAELLAKLDKLCRVKESGRE